MYILGTENKLYKNNKKLEICEKHISDFVYKAKANDTIFLASTRSPWSELLRTPKKASSGLVFKNGIISFLFMFETIESFSKFFIFSIDINIPKIV